jgi:hypothetical protein
MTIHFYEIDQDGRGDNTWIAQTDHAQFLREYPGEAKMLEDAAMFSKMGMSIRFHTQHEYNLHICLDTILENDD